MLIPIRCFSCGKPIAQLWEEYTKRLEKGETPEKAMNALGLSRFCCRRMILSHKEYIDDVIRYKGR